jgi:hypothetical protein
MLKYNCTNCAVDVIDKEALDVDIYILFYCVSRICKLNVDVVAVDYGFINPLIIVVTVLFNKLSDILIAILLLLDLYQQL